MNTILNYLENMFLSLPKTAETERAKQELANMMEDKYNELIAEGKTDNEAVGIVISEFGNLKELAEELGIGKLMTEGEAKQLSGKIINDEEVRSCIENNEKASIGIAIGAMLAIFSVIPLIVIGGLQKELQISDKVVVVVGIGLLFSIIAVAVGILIYNGMQMEKYEYLKKEPFVISDAAAAFVREYKEGKQKSFITKMVTGVVMIILGVMPVIFVGAWEGEDDMAALGVAVLLFIVGLAVVLFVTGGMQHEISRILLQEGEFASKSKAGNKLVDTVSGIYWPIVVCIYLAWSFITMQWGYTWIVWPIAGVLFAAISGICSAVGQKKEQ